MQVNTEGGAYINGKVDTDGGDFIGRDKIIQEDQIRGDKVSGDKVGGDKTSISKIIGANIAIGRGAQVHVNTHVTTMTPAEFAELINELRAKLATVRLEDDAHAAVQQDLANVEAQLAKSEPKLTLIRRGLNNIHDVIEAATDMSATTLALSSLLQQAIQTAQQLFK